jgi:hypothetical protein
MTQEPHILNDNDHQLPGVNLNLETIQTRMKTSIVTLHTLIHLPFSEPQDSINARYASINFGNPENY